MTECHIHVQPKFRCQTNILGGNVLSLTVTPFLLARQYEVQESFCVTPGVGGVGVGGVGGGVDT